MLQQHQPQEEANRNVQAILRRLASEKLEEHKQAEQELRSTIERSTQTIQQNRKRQKRLFAGYLVGTISIYLGFVGLDVLLLTIWHSAAFRTEILAALCLTMALELLLPVLFLTVFFRLARKQRNQGGLLAGLDDVHVISPLLDALSSQGLYATLRNAGPHQDIKKALIRLLPRLKPSDAALLSPRQRKFLCALLRSDEMWPENGRRWGADLKVAILRALEQVGDAQALPTVERLSRSAKDPKVRQAAQECVPFLRQRSQEQQGDQTLLRAASASDPPANVLLRPASSTVETAPQQLLRAGDVPKVEAEIRD